MDAYALARVARALDAVWAGAILQKVWEDESGRLVLKLRRPGKSAFLLASGLPRVHGFGVVKRRPPAPERLPAFAAYLRAHVEGGRLVSARAAPFERLVELNFATRDKTFTLILDAVGPKPRLLLADGEGKIRMASRWDRKGEAGAILPGVPFFAPQRPEGRLTPGEVTRESLVRWLEEGGNVAGRLLGLPAWARGKGFFGDTVEEGWDALRRLDAVYEGSGPLVSEGEGITVSPHDASEADDRVLDRAGEWLLGESSVGEAKAVEDRTGPEEARRRKKLLRRIEKIRQDLAGLPDPEKSRRQADALAACLHCISRGDEEAFVPDPEGGGDEIRIPLDPRLSPGENLNRQHALAKKAIRVRKIAETRLAEAEAELATPPAQVPSTSPQPTQSEARHAQKFRRYRSSDGWLILVGKNRVENDLLLRQAKPWDLWLHARDGAGAHVLLIKPGRDSKPPERTLTEAAGLAALFSSRSSEVRVEIMLAEASRVKKPKGAGPGRVIVSGEKTMLVSPGAGNPQPV